MSNLDAAISQWLSERGFEARRLQPLRGDVSPRRYFRLTLASPPTAILARYPPDRREECRRFAATGDLLRSAGVRVPEVLARDCRRGWMLLEDCGGATLYEAPGLGPRALRAYFARAARIADDIAAIPLARVAELNPPLDGPALERELEQTLELVLEPAGLAGEGDEMRRLRRALRELCEELDRGPRVACHRDFMPRNLVPVAPQPELAVLDHQDLRPGPVHYDLASLVNDSLFPPPEVEAELLALRLPAPGDRLAFRRAAAQRTLKAVGTYAAFARRGVPRHLPLVVPTLERAIGHLGALPEAREAARALAERWESGGRPAGPLLDFLQTSGTA